MADVWKQIMAELGRLLKPYGFLKSGLGFINGHNKEVVRQISIEKFRWNTPAQQRFQLMLSLYLSTGDAGEFTFKGREARYSLVFSKSSGYFWDDEAFLYLVPGTLPDETFFAELQLHVDRDLIPVLQRCTGVHATIAFLEQENQKQGRNIFSSSLAVALARLGRKEESRRHFRQSLGDPEAIRRLAEHYGVSLNG